MSLEATHFAQNFNDKTPLRLLIGESTIVETLIGETVPDGKGGVFQDLLNRSHDLQCRLISTRAANVDDLLWKLCDVRDVLREGNGQEQSYAYRLLSSAILDLTALNKGALS